MGKELSVVYASDVNDDTEHILLMLLVSINILRGRSSMFLYVVTMHDHIQLVNYYYIPDMCTYRSGCLRATTACICELRGTFAHLLSCTWEKH